MPDSLPSDTAALAHKLIAAAANPSEQASLREACLEVISLFRKETNPTSSDFAEILALTSCCQQDDELKLALINALISPLERRDTFPNLRYIRALTLVLPFIQLSESYNKTILRIVIKILYEIDAKHLVDTRTQKRAETILTTLSTLFDAMLFAGIRNVPDLLQPDAHSRPIDVVQVFLTLTTPEIPPNVSFAAAYALQAWQRLRTHEVLSARSLAEASIEVSTTTVGMAREPLDTASTTKKLAVACGLGLAPFTLGVSVLLAYSALAALSIEKLCSLLKAH